MCFVTVCHLKSISAKKISSEIFAQILTAFREREIEKKTLKWSQTSFAAWHIQGKMKPFENEKKTRAVENK